MAIQNQNPMPSHSCRGLFGVTSVPCAKKSTASLSTETSGNTNSLLISSLLSGSEDGATEEAVACPVPEATLPEEAVDCALLGADGATADEGARLLDEAAEEDVALLDDEDDGTDDGVEEAGFEVPLPDEEVPDSVREELLPDCAGAVLLL